MIHRSEYIEQTHNLVPVAKHRDAGFWTEDYYIDRCLIRFLGMANSEWVQRENLFDEEHVNRPN